MLEAFGRRIMLVHGDAQCLADVDYQRFRLQARDPVWQQQFLAQTLEDRRAFARGLRDSSEYRKRTLGMAAYPDLDQDAMRALLRQHGATTLVHGHTHRPGDEALGDGLVRHVLTDWDLDHDPATPRAEHDAGRGEGSGMGKLSSGGGRVIDGERYARALAATAAAVAVEPAVPARPVAGVFVADSYCGAPHVLRRTSKKRRENARHQESATPVMTHVVDATLSSEATP